MALYYVILLLINYNLKYIINEQKIAIVSGCDCLRGSVKQWSKLCRKLVKLLRNFTRNYLKQGTAWHIRLSKHSHFRNLGNLADNSVKLSAPCMIIVKMGSKYLNAVRRRRNRKISSAIIWIEGMTSSKVLCRVISDLSEIWKKAMRNRRKILELWNENKCYLP